MDDEGDAGLDTVMISALEHYSYCPRQCALIHLEQTFADNVYTVRGHQAHQRVDDPDVETRPGIRREYAIPLFSTRLGLTGRADLVEFTGEGPYPVEYKVGSRRDWSHEAIQLAAQALCLEEMTGQAVPRGAIYYRGSRARREVRIDDDLRRLVVETTRAVRDLLAGGRQPPAIDDARCRHCSLAETCMPAASANPRAAARWCANLFTPREE